jgi:hypothetical protein
MRPRLAAGASPLTTKPCPYCKRSSIPSDADICLTCTVEQGIREKQLRR